MADEYISREAARAILKRHEHRVTCVDETNGFGAVKWREDVIYADTAQICIVALPAADVAPVVHARWIEWDDGEGDTFECSACGEVWTLNAGNPIENNMHYCPRCGARMDEEDGDG